MSQFVISTLHFLGINLLLLCVNNCQNKDLILIIHHKMFHKMQLYCNSHGYY